MVGQLWYRHVHVVKWKHCYKASACLAICILVVNPRRACAARVTVVGSVCVCVCVCVCLSVKQHLTYEASVRPENAVTYSAGNEGQKFVGFSLKPLRCRDTALAHCTATRAVGHFYSAENAHAHI